jgi:hypothetical protein
VPYGLHAYIATGAPSEDSAWPAGSRPDAS